GDMAAFTVVNAALYARIAAYLRRISGSAPLAQDLVQETFMRIHRARATFLPGEAAAPWAYTVARNVHRDHVRAARRLALVRFPHVEHGVEVDAETAAIARDAVSSCQRALARMTAAQREAFLLVLSEGVGSRAAASALGTTVAAVKLRLFRARQILHHALFD